MFLPYLESAFVWRENTKRGGFHEDRLTDENTNQWIKERERWRKRRCSACERALFKRHRNEFKDVRLDQSPELLFSPESDYKPLTNAVYFSLTVLSLRSRSKAFLYLSLGRINSCADARSRDRNKIFHPAFRKTAKSFAMITKLFAFNHIRHFPFGMTQKLSQNRILLQSKKASWCVLSKSDNTLVKCFQYESLSLSRFVSRSLVLVYVRV